MSITRIPAIWNVHIKKGICWIRGCILHYHGYKGGTLFARACKEMFQKNYIRAFYLTGLASEEFETANKLLRQSEYGVWKDIYANECFADFKFTAYMLRNFMFYIRNLADGPGFWNWPRELFYNDADRRVWLQMNHNNRDQDWVMYEKMKKLVEMLIFKL